MTKLFNLRNLYKLIVFVFLLITFMKMKTQIVTLCSYNKEISSLNEKIATLKSDTIESNSENSQKDNEDIARKDLKMYYPNETPYKGY